MKLKQYEPSQCAVSKLMGSSEDVDNTSWRRLCETQRQFHVISEGFVYLDHDGTCCIAGLIRTNIEQFFD